MFIFIGFVIAIAIYLAFVYNALVSGRNAVETAWGDIDIQLDRRLALIPNLVDAVKGYMKHERETLDAVIAARSKIMNTSERGERMEAEGVLSGALGKFFALAEAYPDLKAHENVASLMEELSATENKISFARQHYNDRVFDQNNRVESFPSNIVASAFRFGREKLFRLDENAEARQVPKVSFD